jgi:hypothetical protein
MMRPYNFVFALTTAALLAQDSVPPPMTGQAIEKRDHDGNGILVGSPKMYDDSLLQQMLTAAQARLTSLQLLDQTGIAARLGSITGATQQISGVAISAQGLPISQVVSTANGATKQIVDS